jgi:4,5-DOPA dioxygenase extradiol
MNIESNLPLSQVLFLSHGGGPLPLLGDKGHQNLVNFFRDVTPRLGIPSAILVISAHWEEDKSTITIGAFPLLSYDYYGFPKESYKIKSTIRSQKL